MATCYYGLRTALCLASGHKHAAGCKKSGARGRYIFQVFGRMSGQKCAPFLDYQTENTLSAIQGMGRIFVRHEPDTSENITPPWRRIFYSQHRAYARLQATSPSADRSDRQPRTATRHAHRGH